MVPSTVEVPYTTFSLNVTFFIAFPPVFLVQVTLLLYVVPQEKQTRS